MPLHITCKSLNPVCVRADTSKFVNAGLGEATAMVLWSCVLAKETAPVTRFVIITSG
jgi:hypothetical protein